MAYIAEQVFLKAMPDQEVMVENYRCRPPKWEEGRVIRVESIWNHRGEPHHIYEVILKRRNANRFPIRCSVSDAGIRLP